MAKKLILLSHANAVFEKIKAAGLNPSEFKWTNVKTCYNSDTIVSKLVHEQTGFYFLFDYNLSNQHYARYFPGSATTMESNVTKYLDSQFRAVQKWVDNLKREIEAPDLWRVIAEEKKLIEAASDFGNENEPFNIGEQEKISKNLEELKQYLLKIVQLSQEQTQLINRQFDYLKESSQRVGRKDWLMMFACIIMSKIVTLGLQTDVAKEFLRLSTSVFSWLLGKATALVNL